MQVPSRVTRSVDEAIVNVLEHSGIDFACSVPCSLLSGMLECLSKRKRIQHIPVTREEEGVGLCAGAYMGGASPMLLMQNSGLGNSVNALLSLTNLYGMGLLMVLGFRGRRDEEPIEAQIPMGAATRRLLPIVGASYLIVNSAKEVQRISVAAKASRGGRLSAVLLTPKVWSDK